MSLEHDRKRMGTGIAALPDEVLHQIMRLSLFSEEEDSDLEELEGWQLDTRKVLPLVCKRWRDVWYHQGAYYCSRDAGR